VSVVPTATVQAPPVTPTSQSSEEQASDVLSGFVENGGVRIHYEVEGEGPPLVLVHWLTGSLQDWRVFGYADALKESYRLILIDARGHGQSDKPHDPAAYVLEKQAADIVAVLDELGVDKAHYFGYSLGGELGWALAKYVPDRFSSLIIGGASPEDFDPSADIARDRGLGAEEYGRMAADVLSGYGFSWPEIYAIYAATDFEAIIADLQAISAQNFAADLPGMTIPILLLAGAYDEDHTALKAATNKLPNATFASLPGHDHMTAFMQTDLVVELLTKFLAQVEKAALDDATTAKIETIVKQAMTDYPVPGFELCIVKDGQVVYNKGFGLANVASNRPMTPQSVSTQASISKSLTAMAVMQLVEPHKIDLDKPVTAYLPYFTMADPRYKDITVRMLLSHMSGLPDVPIPWDAPLDPTIDPLEQAVRSLRDEQLISAPGEAWNYSGWGYSMLGAIIVKVIGEPFESYMHQRWLEPLGMANSTFVMDEVDPDLYVTGYISAEDGSAAAMEHFVDPRDVPAAGLWSSCDDMTRWARLMLNKGELNGRRLLQPESINAMWTSVASTPWMDALGPWYGPYVGEYGLGWYVGEKAGHRLAGHAGAGDGVNTHIQFAPDDGLAVIAMDNWLKPDPEWYPAGFAAFDVMDLLLGIKPQ
ncbi:MAG: alpha/beta fold hydrolase, partial [Anaerolineae bacterium]